MKESTYKSYDDLPLFLNAELVAQVLGISQAGAYDLLHSEGFPVLKIGTRMVVPKEKFRKWVEEQTGAESCIPGDPSRDGLPKRDFSLCQTNYLSWI